MAAFRDNKTLKISLYTLVFICLVLLPIPSADSKNFEFSAPGDGDGSVAVDRHRRSYESRHNKGKGDNVEKNPAKTQSGGTAGGSKSGSVFATENCTVVVAQIGGTATLPCVVKKFNTAVVSWIRKNDLHLLTVGLSTYNSDDRFMVEHVRHLQNWGLLIKHVQPSDAGFYECQVSTHPSTSILLELRVTEATAEILGAPDLHLKAGSLLRLVCTFRQSTEPPAYVFWYHEQRMINYDEGVKVTMDRTSSVLLVPETDKSHNGNYTCSPSNVVPSSINVHVLNSTVEEKPAAMQHANTSSKSPSSQQMFFINCGTVLFIILTVHKTT